MGSFSEWTDLPLRITIQKQKQKKNVSLVTMHQTELKTHVMSKQTQQQKE